MNLLEKMECLTGAARYDVSCSSSGSSRPNAAGGTGNAHRSGICHSWAADGRCISLLKILLSNHCIYDCAYCVNRASNEIPRTSFSVEELVTLALEFYRRNYIEGLFLSSGVLRSPDYTMERMLQIVDELRRRGFHGYIHLKTIPGASLELVQKAGLHVDRLSVNIELPSEASLQKLAPGKRKQDILQPMACIGEQWHQHRLEHRKNRRAPRFSPAGQSTQMIVGASPEDDRHILYLAQRLYQTYRLKRVYYSAYVPVGDQRRVTLGGEQADLLRENRLYQADWLVRLYGFDARELLEEQETFLDRELDPKSAWALRHFDRFPVEINQADYEQLLRVPGIGFMSARRITATRRHAAVREEDLAKLGVVMKRARFFITCGGRRPDRMALTPDTIRRQLLPAVRKRSAPTFHQPELFAASS